MLRNEAAARTAADGSAARELALTRWLDGASLPLRRPERCWAQGMRSGASSCAASRRIRDAVFGTDSAAANALAPKWMPSPHDGGGLDDDWGGPFGKACAHNEVVMHCLRPFEPMQVLNTRCCSKALPAPGNAGFDGCLEFLKTQCLRKRRAATVWDFEHFVFIGSDGKVDMLDKRPMLQWTVRRLEFVMPALKRLTVDCKGRASAAALIQLVDAFVCLAAKSRRLQVGSVVLGTKPSRLVAEFVVGRPPSFKALYDDAPPEGRLAKF
mmetsp:Transcript_20838/g.70593  ORF Transcript_20838/g.70593 Transcript_20838/m.70593 type:complete len:268 (+) Transcript_20838:62-865(+)